MPKKFDPEVKARAVRMVRDHLAEYKVGDGHRVGGWWS